MSALGATAIEAHLSEVVEVSKEPKSSEEQESFKDLDYDDDNQKQERDDRKAETSSDVIRKKEMDLVFKQRDEILPKKNKKHKTKEHTKKKGNCETEEQNEDGEKTIAQAVNSPEKENDTSYVMRCNPCTTPYLER